MRTVLSSAVPATVRRAVRPLAVLVVAVAVLSGCWPSVGTDFADPGPFPEVSVRQDAVTTYYWPTNLGAQDRDHPVILWGNGTFLNPTHYDALLRHFASHGFIVAAANTTNAGSGREMLAGLDSLTTFNATPGNVFHGKVDLTRVGATGHSQGGAGTMNAGADPRVDTIVPIEGAFGNAANVRGSAFYLAGELDTTVPPAGILTAYGNSSHVPAAYGNVAGADHLQPIVNGNAFRPLVTAWFRWHLMGDVNARDMFVGPAHYAGSDAFVDFRTNARLQALYPPAS